uniref:Uncharacterized protein LOC110218358 isoform X2 n=1 Tax=Phascolarctos cinereus TaxID=38626 RepID=A0A6P5LLJ6_PHACI|nr:uncharacterized protein LOC110218358 isoform X2 [Phascolarctos cinereus]
MPLGHPSRSRRHSRINTTHPPTVLSGWGTPPSRDWNHRAVCGCPYHCETPEERIGSRPLHSIVNRQPSRESSGLPCRLPCRGWTPELQPSLPNRHHFHFPSATGRSHGAHSRAGSRGVYRVQSPGPECPPLPSRLGAYQTSCQTPQADGHVHHDLLHPLQLGPGYLCIFLGRLCFYLASWSVKVINCLNTIQLFKKVLNFFGHGTPALYIGLFIVIQAHDIKNYNKFSWNPGLVVSTKTSATSPPVSFSTEGTLGKKGDWPFLNGGEEQIGPSHDHRKWVYEVRSSTHFLPSLRQFYSSDPMTLPGSTGATNSMAHLWQQENLRMRSCTEVTMSQRNLALTLILF